MTLYHVHIYREMRLYFQDVEADTPEAAADIARDKLTSDADALDDCDGESLSALVDVKGDEEYEHSRFIDFEAEHLRKAALELLTALEYALEYLKANDDGEEDVANRIAAASAAITKATAGKRDRRAA